MNPNCSKKKRRGPGCSKGGQGNAIHHVTADSVVCFVNTYPLDSDLSGG